MLCRVVDSDGVPKNDHQGKGENQGQDSQRQAGPGDEQGVFGTGKMRFCGVVNRHGTSEECRGPASVTHWLLSLEERLAVGLIVLALGELVAIGCVGHGECSWSCVVGRGEIKGAAARRKRSRRAARGVSSSICREIGLITYAFVNPARV